MLQAGKPLHQEHRLGALPRQVFPDFLGGKTEDGCNPAHQGLGDQVHGGLGGTAGHAVGPGGVLAVLDHIQVEAAQVHGAEVMQLLVDLVELEAVVGGYQLGLQQGGAIHRPAIQRQQVGKRQLLRGRIETIQVGQQEARGIANPSVGVSGALEDLVADHQLAAVIGGRYPQAQDIGAQVVHHGRRRDHIAYGFGHLAAVAVHREAVGENALVGRLPIAAYAGEQGGLEPAAVLVGTLQVQVCRRLQALALAQHAGVGHPRVEPDIQGISDLVVVIGLGAQQFARVQFKPGIDARGLDSAGHLFHQRQGLGVQFTGLPVHEQRYGHAPGALARYTPVGAIGQHGIDARLAPLRQPAHLLHRGQRLVQQTVLAHAHEPLGRGPEDDGGLVAPAVGVGVGILLVVQQHAALRQQLDHGGIGLEYILAGKVFRIRQVDTVATYRVVHLQPVLLPHREVVLAVGRRGVHSAGTGLGGDVLAQDHGHLPVQEAVLQQLVFQGGTAAATQYLELFQAVAARAVLRQGLGHQQGTALARYQQVLQLRIQADRHIGRQRPGGGGPDGHRDLAAVTGATGGIEGCGIGRREGHINRRGLLVLVLDLGFRQGGATVGAPVHGFRALVQVTVLYDTPQGAHDIGLEGKIHGEVGIEPIPQHTHAHEILALRVHLAGGVVAAALAKLGGAYLDPGFTDFFLYIQFDGQAVAIPAGHIGCVEAVQGPGLDNDVLENLVHGVAEVQLTVGVGRAIVEDVFRPPGAHRPDFPVQVHVLPLLQSLGLALGQAGLHGEGRARQVQAVFVFTHK